MHARTIPPTRDVALLLGSAGGVSGKGSGASPSQDALNLVRWSLARGFLDPRRDRLVAVHCSELNPLTASGTRVTHELVTPSEFPEWMPPALAHAFGRFAARGGGKGAAAALLESPLAPAEALVRFVSGELRGVAEGRHSARLAAFRAERAPGFARATAAAARDGTTPHGALVEEPFPVDLWPAEDAVPSRRRRGDDEATKPAFDLVLVGASDRNEGAFGALRRAAMGSVSRRVLERSPAPVLVVRARDARRASGFGNDAAFAHPQGKREKASTTARRADAKGHARSRSFPGNWRMLVDEEEEGDGNGIVLSSSGRGTAHDDTRMSETNETNETTESRSESLRSGSSRVAEGGTVRAGRVGSADALVHRIPQRRVCERNVPPVTGNVLCVAHDGGEDGVALVRWTLRTLLRSTDRAVVVVHVAPGHSPAALAAAFGTERNTERSTTRSPGRGLGPVADALLQSDEDVARAVAAFRREQPPPATAPASSVLVVGAGEAPELAETRGPLPSAHDTVTRASSRSRVGNRVAAGLGPFLPPGSAEGGFHEKWGLGALLRAASERSADVLVVGSRRLNRRIVSGGAARACARLAPCAALAVPADALAPFRRK